MTTPIDLSQFSPKDQLAIVHAAAREGNIGELTPKEIRAASKTFSPQALTRLLKLQRHRLILMGTVRFNRSGAVKATEAFVKKFAQVDALKKTVRSFPISKIEDLKDPKTRGMPKIAAPAGTKVKDIIDPNAIADRRIRAKVLRGATVDQIRGRIPIRGGKVELVALSRPGANGRVDVSRITDRNFLIYLPKPYVVATSHGIHREMYPHDSSYVIEAMLRNPTAENIKRAGDMLDNCLYQVNNFGFIMNGNRGYYLTRSQTNNIPANVWQFYRVIKGKWGVAKANAWLKKVGLPLAKKVFAYWTHRSAEVRLSHGRVGYRLRAHGRGPCKEVWESHGVHKAYYFRVLDDLVKYRGMKDSDSKKPSWAKGFDYAKVVTKVSSREVRHLRKPSAIAGSKGMEGRMFILPGAHTKSGKDEPVIKVGNAYYTFTAFYYTSDRMSRVSGYDSNHMFGPFNAFTKDFVPVAHQVQLFRHATDIARMHRVVGKKGAARVYATKAASLKKVIVNDLWDPGNGMLFEYDASTKKRRTNYPFTSSGYALWAGVFDIDNIADFSSLRSMVHFIETKLEGPNGLYASGVKSGLHWDKPICWPIHNGMVVHGLRRYAKALRAKGGYRNVKHAEWFERVADRIALKYLKANYRYWIKSKGRAVPENFRPTGAKIYTGYETQSNYTWNLAAVWDLYRGLSSSARANFHSYVALMKQIAPQKPSK